MVRVLNHLMSLLSYIYIYKYFNASLVPISFHGPRFEFKNVRFLNSLIGYAVVIKKKLNTNFLITIYFYIFP